MRHVTHPHHKVHCCLGAAELNNKNIYVLQTGASLCYKLGQLHYYKLGQVFLQIYIQIGNRYYKIGQNLLQIGAGITD